MGCVCFQAGNSIQLPISCPGGIVSNAAEEGGPIKKKRNPKATGYGMPGVKNESKRLIQRSIGLGPVTAPSRYLLKDLGAIRPEEATTDYLGTIRQHETANVINVGKRF